MTDRIIELAKLAGMEVHPRKMQIRVGADAVLGLDSTAIRSADGFPREASTARALAKELRSMKA